METPWGKADKAVKLAEGIYSVSTPSHGGLMIGAGVARKLSAPAQQIGEQFGPWLAYEEDCAYAAVFAERPDLYASAVVLEGLSVPELGGCPYDADIQNYFGRIARTWFPDEYGVPCQFCQRGHCYKRGHNA